MNSLGAKKNPFGMISPSVRKNRMWALIIHLDSGRIDPPKWQTVGRVGELLPLPNVDMILHTDMYVCTIKIHGKTGFLYS